MAHDRTFVITAHKTIKADGLEIKAGDKVAMVTGLVSPETLFGLMQFHGFKAEEVDAEQMLAEHAEDEASDAEPESADAADVDSGAEASGAVASDIDASYPPEATEPAQETADISATEQAVAAFIADGLDEKTARALAESNGLTPDDVRQMIVDGTDLLDLDDVGVKRAEKILAAYTGS